METAKNYKSVFFAAFAVLLLDVEALDRPLCISQYSLVNYACSMLPYSQPEPHPNYPPSDDDDDDGGDMHGLEGHQGDGSPQQIGQQQGNTTTADHQGHSQHGHENNHRRHRHRTHHESTPAEDNCCRWLKELDPRCVCDQLVRLPPFLSRPAHAYTLAVGEACTITYECAGRREP